MKAHKITLRQIVLLCASQRSRVTAPEIAELLDLQVRVVAKHVAACVSDALLEVSGWRLPTDRDSGAREFQLTGAGRAALRIPRDTPMKWPTRSAPETVTHHTPAPRAPAPNSALLFVESEAVADDPPPRPARPRTHSGSGVIAGTIEIGRGYRWGSH